MNPFIIERRATSIDDLQARFHIIDAKRLEDFGRVLLECGRQFDAERAFAFANEHRMVADRLSGAVAIGAGEDDAKVTLAAKQDAATKLIAFAARTDEDAAATRSAIAFGGPLPVRADCNPFANAEFAPLREDRKVRS
jgi:hypothetical protein